MTTKRTKKLEVKEVTKVLKKLRVPASIKGYNYLREVILMVMNTPDKKIAMTKDVYPSIAEKFHDTASRVERAMRHAVEEAHKKADIGIFEDIIGTTEKPTNGEFVFAVADYLEIYIFS